MKFDDPPRPADEILSFNKQLIVNMKYWALLLGVFRTHPVAIGHQNIVLPMPDEVDYLVSLYLNWLNKEIRSLGASLDNISPEEFLVSSLSLACDAHTKMVHIHPFSDGNGRLARMMSGMILRSSLLPPPLFIKEKRHEYIKAVGSNSIFGNSTTLCKMHADAVLRSMDTMIELSKNGCHIA